MYAGMVARYEFKLDNNFLVNERTIFNFLDFIGEVGGLVEGLKYAV